MSPEEFKALFDPAESNCIWPNSAHYTLNLLAACTGTRLGEVQALRDENVFTGYILVCYSWDKKYGLKDTNTHDSREIPISPTVARLPELQKEKNPGGFLFSSNSGESPFYCRSIVSHLYQALNRIGIQYFLGQFAHAEGKRGEQFYTARCNCCIGNLF